MSTPGPPARPRAKHVSAVLQPSAPAKGAPAAHVAAAIQRKPAATGPAVAAHVRAATAAPAAAVQRMRSDGFASRYPSRASVTPEEAAQQREQQAQAERDELARRQAEAQRRAEEAERHRLSQPPKAFEGRGFMDEYAINVHQAYDWGEHEKSATTSIGRLQKEGSGLIRYQVASQRPMQVMKSYVGQHYETILTTGHFTSGTPANSHIHAEMWLLYWAHSNGYKLVNIGVSKEICPQCQYMLKKAGVQFDPAWAGKESPEWRDPWDYYGQDNPYL